MRISINDLNEKKACETVIITYKANGLDKIDWSKVKKINHENSDLTWLIETFKLSIEMKNSKYLNGKLIHYKTLDGFEKWYEYNDQGLEIHYKDSKGFEHWTEYNDQGKEIHFKDSNGFEHWWKYNDQGLKIHFKTSNGFERSLINKNMCLTKNV